MIFFLITFAKFIINRFLIKLIFCFYKHLTNNYANFCYVCEFINMFFFKSSHNAHVKAKVQSCVFKVIHSP